MARGANGPDSPRKPKAKRPRVEDLSGQGECLIRMAHSDVWFDDGNVVLAAGGQAFRVYKGLLSKSSAILAERLSAPRSTVVEKFEDCDVVRLRGDHPVDVSRVLEVIFYGLDSYSERKPVNFPVVASWIKMAYKYEMHRILDHALSRLQSFFSDDAGQWRDAFKRHASHSIKVTAEDAVVAVNLARLTQTFSILPTALYICCQLPSTSLLYGVFRASADGSKEQLTDDDIVRCMNAREELMRFNLLSTFQIWNPRVSHLCTDTVNCLATLEHQTRVIREASVLHQYTLSATIREVIGDVCLCVACEDMLRKRLERVQRKHWAELPHMFDLHITGWDDRVEETVAAIGYYERDEYGGDGPEGVPEGEERADFVEFIQDVGLQDVDKVVDQGDLDEEQTDDDDELEEGGGSNERDLEYGPAQRDNGSDEETEKEEAGEWSGRSLFGSFNSTESG